jgi:hypothetical protein
LAILATALPAVVAAGPLAAQRLYRFEVGASGGYASFDSKSDLKSGFGATLRAGYWFWGPLSGEVEASFVPTHTSTSLNRSLTVRTTGAHLLYNHMLNYSTSAFAGLGVTSLTYGDCPSQVSIPGYGICGSTTAIQFGAGVRMQVKPTILMRYEFYVNRSQAAGQNFSHFGLLGGVSVMLKSEPLVDSDGDGVYDRYDRCPGTRLGALVDKHGCPSDQDGDGVPDGLDRCPNTPKGAEVDAVGCTFDSDSDGVVDGLDQCPDTPAGAVVDAKGCPLDEDGDGVPDGIDRCPATPPGTRVDALGCPLDSDGDGVPDGIDLCPGTPAGTPVDANGCPMQPEISPADTATELEWVVPGQAFPFRSAELSAEAYPILDSVATTLINQPKMTAEVNGYAQDRLVPSDNTRLSQRRADAIRAYLISKGVPVARVSASGLGSTILIVQDTTEAARTLNRRAEIKLKRIH